MSDDPGNRNLGPLYRRHRSELLAYLTRRVNCRETANDLLQDAFIRLMNSEVAKIGNVRAFLYRIANNLSIDHARRNRVRGVSDEQELQALAGDADPQNSAIAGNTLGHLRRLIDGLPSPTREVFLLARVEQLSYKEIAIRLGLDARAVERHLNKAMAHCAAVLHANESR
ncbi:RNA polymerase sigma factor [Pseudomonas poae]|nr:RNA polymerase sigma factor [Pseudomonas poae]